MHPFSILTLGIFVAGYITARWDLVTRLYELAIFAWDHGVVVCVSSSSSSSSSYSFFFFFFSTSNCWLHALSFFYYDLMSFLTFFADANGERIRASFGFLFPLSPSD